MINVNSTVAPEAFQGVCVTPRATLSEFVPCMVDCSADSSQIYGLRGHFVRGSLAGRSKLPMASVRAHEKALFEVLSPAESLAFSEAG